MAKFSPSRCCCEARCRGLYGEIPGVRKLWFSSTAFDPVEVSLIQRAAYGRLLPSTRGRDDTYCAFGFAGVVPMPATAILPAADMPLRVSLLPENGYTSGDAPVLFYRLGVATAPYAIGYSDHAACGGATVRGRQAEPADWRKHRTDTGGASHLGEYKPVAGSVQLFADRLALREGDSKLPYQADDGTPYNRFSSGAITFTQLYNPPAAGASGPFYQAYYLLGGEGCPGDGIAKRISVTYTLTTIPPT